MRRSPADSTNRSLAAFGKLQHIQLISYRPLRGRYDEGPSKGPSISDFLAALAASPLLARPPDVIADRLFGQIDRAHSSACASNRSRRKNASSRLPKPQQPHLQ